MIDELSLIRLARFMSALVALRYDTSGQNDSYFTDVYWHLLTYNDLTTIKVVMDNIYPYRNFQHFGSVSLLINNNHVWEMLNLQVICNDIVSYLSSQTL